MSTDTVRYLEDFLNGVAPPETREGLSHHLLTCSPITLRDFGEEGGLVRASEEERAGRMFDIASGVISVARGLLAVASVDSGSCCSILSISEQMVWPRRHDIDCSTMLRYRNLVPQAANLEPVEFRPQTYGLHTITLQAGLTYATNRMEALLTLAFQKGDTLKLVSLDLRGGSCVYELFRVLGGDLTEAALGETTLNDIIHLALRGYDRAAYDIVMGIPRFLDFVADGLPKLGGYLEQLASHFCANTM